MGRCRQKRGARVLALVAAQIAAVTRIVNGIVPGTAVAVGGGGTAVAAVRTEFGPTSCPSSSVDCPDLVG